LFFRSQRTTEGPRTRQPEIASKLPQPWWERRRHLEGSWRQRGGRHALDDGFAYHYFGIYGDPFQKIFIILEDAIGCSFDINLRIDLKETKLKA